MLAYLRDGVQQPGHSLREHLPVALVVHLGTVPAPLNAYVFSCRPSNQQSDWLAHRYVFFATSVDPNRVKLRPLGSLHIADANQGLMEFDVKHAACYTPEDEAKLRSVINGGGEDRFNKTIRGLSTLVSATAGSE